MPEYGNRFFVRLSSRHPNRIESREKVAAPGTEFAKETIYHNDYSDETLLKVAICQPNQTYLKNLDQVNGESHHTTGS